MMVEEGRCREEEEAELRAEIWGELRGELWGEIGKRLGNHVDTQVFRSTCKTWRSYVPCPFPSIFPLIVPSLPHPPHLVAPHPSPGLFHYIVEHTGYLIISQNKTDPNPVFLVFETRRNGVFSPFRLFSPGPADKITWPCPQKLDLVEHLPIKFLFKTYYLHRSFHNIDRSGDSTLVQKLVLFSCFSNSNRSTSINPEFALAEQGVDLAVVALLPKGQLILHSTTKTHNNNNNNDWKFISPDDANYKFDDIVNYGGKLWAVDIDGGAFVLDDYVSLNMTRVAASPITFIDGKSYVCNRKTSEMTPITSPIYPKEVCNTSFNHYDNDSLFKGRKRLVEASGKLYMLFPCRLVDHSANQLKVFELNTKNQWEEVESIGNHSFFIGPGFAFSMVATEELTGYRWRNCIFLTGVSFCRSVQANTDYPLFTEMLEPGPTIGVYSLVDNKFRKILPKDYPPIFCTQLPSSLNPKDVAP